MKNETKHVILSLLIIVCTILITACSLVLTVKTSQNNKSEGEINSVTYESVDHNVIIPPANVLPETYSRKLNEEDKYLLAKIAMAEAEGESLETKILVILTILNRVESDEKYFPDTIEEVIFQSNKGVYQFSPVMPGGRWWRIEPNEECWEAVEIVNAMEEDISDGALYFEACSGESWHSKNLKFICQSDNTRFYK